MANNTRKKLSSKKATSAFANTCAYYAAKTNATSASATMRKVSLSTLATVLTAATCLGGQPILASSNILLPPTTAAFAQEVRSADTTTPWLHTPNILEFQRYRFANSNGNTGSTADLGEYDNTTKKSDMYAHLEKNGNDQYLVFDVFFNNDGKSMVTHSTQHQYMWQIPYAIADLKGDGSYKGDTLSNVSFDFYKRNQANPQMTNAVLSRDISLFEKDNSKSFVTGFLGKDNDHNGSIYLYTLGIRMGASNRQDLNATFHNNAGDGVISNATTLKGIYSKYSYGIGLRTTNVNYAVHMHCKVKLRQGVTLEDIQDAYTLANTSSYGTTTNSAYTFISGRERWSEPNLKRTKSDKIPPKLYLNGKEIGDKDNNSITVYQGDIPTITFGTSDDSGKVNSFSVNGLPNGKGDVTENGNGMEATEAKHHNHVVSRIKFEYKNGNTPANTDYTVTVSATDASGNKVEKKVTVHLKNLNQKYPSPTANELTVDWGHTLTEEELKKQIQGNDGKGNNGNGTVTFIGKLPKTNLSESTFKRSKNKLKVTAKITYADGSSHTVDIPVTVRKPLAFEHAPKGSENAVTVGDKLKQPSDYITLENNSGNKVKPQKVEWHGGEPNSSTIGKFNNTVRVNYTDGSRKDTTVTFNVKPKTPVIETDLNGRAKIKNQKVVVNVGSGFIPNATNTVTLYDANNNAIGSTTEIKDGKATITVANGIPAGNVYAVTNSSYNNSQDKHTRTFNLSS
ncbi:peptidase, partial [Bifidobacteriaceae bacterium NR019]